MLPEEARAYVWDQVHELFRKAIADCEVPDLLCLGSGDWQALREAQKQVEREIDRIVQLELKKARVAIRLKAKRRSG